ncbi:hypothetical protein JXB12_07575 [candidate division KSB1 bacterium]|nr:hypothetical protein [candidate division KSB1 bacterium]
MVSWKTALLGMCILIWTSPLASGNSMNGGYGLHYVGSAWTLKQGHMTVKAQSRFFGKVSPNSAVTVWDVQGALSVNYGVSDHLEMQVAPIIYQDSHKGKGGKGYNLPDDLFLSLKLGSYRLKNSSLAYGFMLQTRFPTAKYHNVVFEPYSAGTVSWGLKAMGTYSRDPLYPEDNLNAYLNLGYYNHNDVGQRLSEDQNLDSIKVSSMSQEFTYSLGISFPNAEFDFSLELHGNAFIQRPPKQTAYSLENYAYLTPGISYRVTRWLAFNFGADFRISSNNDESLYYFDHKIHGMPNYPAWRINLGMKMQILPTEVFTISEKDILIKKAESRRELFEQIIREQRETESAEEELERIKNERQKAERELERLRRILEGDYQRPDEEKKENEPIE